MPALCRPLTWRPFPTADLAVSVVILCLGALAFFLYEKAADFLHEDVSYVELADSLLQRGSYSFNSVTERVQPPGLSVILAGKFR
jgi:hypothetical protein